MAPCTTPHPFVGIDVSKKNLAVCSLPQKNFFSCPNEAEGLAELVKQLSDLQPRLIVVEATGGFERGLIAALLEAKLPVALVNPRQVRSFAGSMNRLAKTDRLDAELLALFAQRTQPRILEKAPEKQAALSARTSNPIIRKFAKRLEAAGKPFKVVIVACMRKLLVILNTLAKNN